MNRYVLTAINIFCYFATAALLSLFICVYSVSTDTDSPEGLQLHQCMDTANTLAPDADTKLLIQRGCIGNYIISAG